MKKTYLTETKAIPLTSEEGMMFLSLDRETRILLISLCHGYDEYLASESLRMQWEDDLPPGWITIEDFLYHI